MNLSLSREDLGRAVRTAWNRWACQQENPKSSWLATWDYLDEGQREVDMQIAEAVLATHRIVLKEAALQFQQPVRIADGVAQGKVTYQAILVSDLFGIIDGTLPE